MKAYDTFGNEATLNVILKNDVTKVNGSVY